MAKITSEAEGDLDVKRFYLPCFVIEDECDVCKETIYWADQYGDYLSSPSVGFGTQVKFHFYCEDCDKEWDVEGQLHLTVKL